jgi:hypothetical protein
MPQVTYYVAMTFVKTEDGDLVPGDAKVAQSSAEAKSLAARLAASNAGAIAFSRTYDPATGDSGPAEIIARFGETAGDVE